MIADRLGQGAVAAYRGLTACLEPAIGPLLSYRQRRGKEDPRRRGERFGLSDERRPDGRLLWVHAASVGETNAVLPLVDRLADRGYAVLLTTGTITSAGVVESYVDARTGPGTVIHQFVPLDFPRAIGRFLDHWRPDVVLFVESELWPVIIHSLSHRQIPLIIINARMSDRSWRTWSRFSAIAKAVLSPTSLVLAQSEKDAERYRALGAPQVKVTGNMKFDAPAPGADAALSEHYERLLSNKSVVMAASTHEGEEQALFSAVKSLQSQIDNLVILIAPRHPERGSGVQQQAIEAGFAAGLRSKGDEPGEKRVGNDKVPIIYIADTIGELGLWYRLSDLVFVGGTLSERGGQNPIEAAKLGVPVIHGPNVWNFAEIFAGLDLAGAALPIASAEDLPAALSHLMENRGARERMADAASRYVGTLTGAAERTLQEIVPYLDQRSEQ